MDISCTCNSCGSKFKVPAQYQGRKAKCSKCAAALTVPKIAVAINPADKSSPGPPRQPPLYRGKQPAATESRSGSWPGLAAHLCCWSSRSACYGELASRLPRLSSATAPAASGLRRHRFTPWRRFRRPEARGGHSGRYACRKRRSGRAGKTGGAAECPDNSRRFNPAAQREGRRPTPGGPGPDAQEQGKGAHNSKPGKGKGGRDGSGQAFADWIQDFATAQAKAAAENKDILLLFDGSDWCEGSIRLTHEVFSQKEFHAQADAKYVLVLIDFPKKERPRSESIIPAAMSNWRNGSA